MRCCCWFRSPFLLACGESVGESVVRPYWLEKIPTSIRPTLLRWLAFLHMEWSDSIYRRVVLEKDSSAESIYGHEAVRVPVRPCVPMLLLADSRTYHAHQEDGASAYSYSFYFCLVRPLCVVYAFVLFNLYVCTLRASSSSSSSSVFGTATLQVLATPSVDSER